METVERNMLKQKMTEKYPTISELIMQRRRQVWIHSIIYYELNDNVVSDIQWAKWANQLVELQRKYPGLSKSLPHYDIFKDFDPSTGYDLPLRDPGMMAKAIWLLEYDRKMKEYIDE